MQSFFKLVQFFNRLVVDLLVTLVLFEQSLVYLLLLSLLLLLNTFACLVIGLSSGQYLGRKQSTSGLCSFFKVHILALSQLVIYKRRTIILGLHCLSFLFTLKNHLISNSLRLTITIMYGTSSGVRFQKLEPLYMRAAPVDIFDFLVLFHLNLKFSYFVAYVDGRFG